MADDRSTTRPPLRVVRGGSGDAALPPRESASHVCTWCALRFPSRAALDRHHATSPECRANQKVSSPLQTRYGDADMVWTQPGEHTLNRVRAKSCRHVHPRARLVDAAGATIGYQCGWCYSVLRDDLPG
jgi:hypothetical protein